MAERAAISWMTPLRRRGVLLYTAAATMHSALPVALPLLLGDMVDSLIAGSFPGKPLVLYAFLALLNPLLHRELSRSIQNQGRMWEREMQFSLLDRYGKMPPVRSGAFAPGEAALKFFRDAAAAGEFLRVFYPQFLNATVSTALALAAVFSKSRIVAGVFVLYLPLLFLPTAVWNAPFRKIRRILRSFNDLAMNRIFECMHILPYLKSLAAEEPYSRSVRRRLCRYSLLNRTNDRLESDFEAANRLLLVIGEFAVLAVSAVLACRKVIPVGDVIVFQALFLSLLNSFSGVLRLLPNMRRIAESLDSVNGVLAAEERENTDSGNRIENAAGEIVADHITFAYPGGRREILHDFSCSIRGGSIVGVTGENGAGKTTLLKLLTGFLAPQQGSITVDGVDLRHCILASFRAQIASVFQEMLLITGSLEDNISLLNRRYTREDIRRALELSGADAVAARFPEGLAHEVDFRGGGLSGGERQKLAIARALIRRPKILIFDEVTNHLDYGSRLKMRDLLSHLRGNTTVLLVSHDPELLTLCDQEIALHS